MIVDDNAVLFEGALNGTPKAVGLTSLSYPGKMEPILVAMNATEDLAGATSVTIKLTQSDTETGVYEDVPNATVTVPAASWKAGARMGFKYLPRNVTKSWIKLALTVAGTATGGGLFAAVVREDNELYEPGMYIDAGKVVG